MASDHFCLIWNNFQNSILSALGNLQVCQDLVDVTLMCEGKNVKAHKVILSACSPYFRNLFKETPCQHPIIILKDVTHADLTALLQFMYQGEVMVSQDSLSSFLKTAELLQISGLAGSSQSTGLENNDDLPRALPEVNLEKPPDTSDSESDKRVSSEVSFKRQKREREKEPVEIVEIKQSNYIQPEPEQSCSYDTSSPIIVKTESLDREYDDMDTDLANIDNYDNSNSQLEEPSILERSLKSQSDFYPMAKRIKSETDGNESKKWNSSKPAQCPYCLVFIKQARNVKRHIKYYCQNSGQKYFIPKVTLTVDEPTTEECNTTPKT